MKLAVSKCQLLTVFVEKKSAPLRFTPTLLKQFNLIDKENYFDLECTHMSDDTRAPNTITSLLNKKTLQYDKEENLNGYEISNKSTNFETQPQTTSKPDAISLIRQSRDDHNRSLRAIG